MSLTVTRQSAAQDSMTGIENHSTQNGVTHGLLAQSPIIAGVAGVSALFPRAKPALWTRMEIAFGMRSKDVRYTCRKVA